MALRCLGIDPGLGRAGFALVAEQGSTLTPGRFGCIETPSGEALPRRLLRLSEAIEQVLDEASPDCVAVERLFFGRNVTTAEMVWQARGVLLLAAARRALPIFEPSPAEVKMAATGTGNADKGQVQGMVCRLLGLRDIPKPDDAADALAVAIAGIALARRAAMSR